MGGHVTLRREENCMQSFCEEVCKEETTWKT